MNKCKGADCVLKGDRDYEFYARDHGICTPNLVLLRIGC